MISPRSLLAVVFLASPAFAQTKPAPAPRSSPSPVPSAPTQPLAPKGYRLTRTDGSVYLIKDWLKQGSFFVTTDDKNKTTQHLVSSVASIEPLDDEEYKEAAASYTPPATSVGGRRTARTSAPSTSRTRARKRPPDYWPDVPLYLYGGFVGGTGGTHVGPRGGIYHYSASGNKVYHKR